MEPNLPMAACALSTLPNRLGGVAGAPYLLTKSTVASGCKLGQRDGTCVLIAANHEEGAYAHELDVVLTKRARLKKEHQQCNLNE